MHHVVLEQWSRGASAMHRRDPRAKCAALLVFLVVLATAHREVLAVGAALLALLVGALLAARVPLSGALARAATVLPFTLLFGAVCWLAGDVERGLAVVLKSYLSAIAVVTLVSTTPLPLLLRGLEMAGVPRFLLMVAQFLSRYLFVISEEAQHMRAAAAARGSDRHPLRFHAAAGRLAVLFARSYERAEGIHHAMLARGFAGRFHTLALPRFAAADAAFLACAALAPVLLRAAVERFV